MNFSRPGRYFLPHYLSRLRKSGGKGQRLVRGLFERVWNPRLLNSSHTDHLHGCYTLCNYEGAVRKIISS